MSQPMRLDPLRHMAAPLWRGRDLIDATGATGPADWSAFGISIDSRSVEPGDIFVALRGPRFDGHDYVETAFAAGAAAAIVHRDVKIESAHGPLMRVDDSLRAIADLGRAARARSKAPIAAVTGSVGKTGMKDALYRCLSRQSLAHASVKSFNNDIGVPLSLARMPDYVDYGVFEIGMNHAGEIAALSPQVRPHVAIITTVAGAHREFFASDEAIADAKAEIFSGLTPGGVAVLNRDNAHYDRLAAAARAAGVERILSFGIENPADVRATQIALHDNLSCVAADIAGTKLLFKVGVPGRHWVMNALGALAVVDALGGDISLAALALSELQALPGRGQRSAIETKTGPALLIDDSYNANPISMRAAFATLGHMAPKDRGRRIAVLGDMAELGPDAAEAHAGLAGALIEAGVEVAIGVGPLMRNLIDALEGGPVRAHARPDSDAAYELLSQKLRGGDIVLVKGSNVSGLGKLAGRLKQGLQTRTREGA